MEFSINGKKVQADLSAYTFVVYEQEFGGDFLADVLGKVSLDDSTDEIALDFTQTDWSKLSKAVWSMVKTVDDNLPNYASWAKGVREVNMFELNAQVGDAIADAFFHTAPAEEQTGKHE